MAHAGRVFVSGAELCRLLASALGLDGVGVSRVVVVADVDDAARVYVQRPLTSAECDALAGKLADKAVVVQEVAGAEVSPDGFVTVTPEK